MSKEKPSIWLVLISLFMLFVSGAWTVASIMPFMISKTIRSIMIVTVSASNVSFLATLLAAMLQYSGYRKDKNMKKMMVYSFAAGIIALMISIILFSTSYLMLPPQFFPD